MKLQRVAAAMPFAQLLGLAKRAEDDDDAKRARRAEEEKDDDKDENATRGEDDERDDEARSARADEEDDDGDAEEAEEEESEEGDDKDDKKSRKAKSKGKRAAEDEEDEGGDDGDEEGRKAKSARSAVRRERARCAKIIAHGVAVGSVRQACVLAFDTGMGVKAAVASLNACKADGATPQRAGLHERMAAAGVPNVGSDAEGGGTPPGMSKVAAAIIAAGEKARGETSRK